MTNRITSFLVILRNDIREDDASAIASAIEQIRGVLSVTANVADISTTVAETRARHDLGRKLWEIIYPRERPDDEAGP